MASRRRHRPRSLAARLLEASFHASFGGFLLWLVWVVVRAPATQLVTALVGKLAFAMAVGTVGTGWLLALVTLTGADETPPLPDALAGLCPACGNHVLAAHTACARCGLAGSHTQRWYAVAPLAAGFFGLLRFPRRGSRRGRYQMKMSLPHRMDVPHVQATAQIGAEGQLVHAQGSSRHPDGSELRWTRRPPVAAGVDYRHEPHEVGWQCDEVSRRDPDGDGVMIS